MPPNWPGRKGEDFRLVVSVAAAGIELGHPRRRVVQAVGADLQRHAVVIQLADAGHVVAGLLKQLRQADGVGDVLAELRRVFEHACLIGSQPGEKARPARVAERELAIRPVEPDAASGQFVDARRFHRFIAITSELVVQIVRDNVEHV